MLPRLVDICSNYLKEYVNPKTALSMLLLAHAHNAQQLERYCVHYIAIHEADILQSSAFKHFTEKAHPQLYVAISSMIDNEVKQSFMQITIANLQRGHKASSSSLENVATRRSLAKQENNCEESLSEIMAIENILSAHEYIFLQE